MPGSFTDLIKNKGLMSRRNAFKLLGGALSVSGIYLLYISLKSQKNIDLKREKVIIPNTVAEGVTIYGAVIIKKEGSKFTVFSSKCTHLGCNINRQENDQLVCPCHGSKFNYNGEAVSGPASKPLEKLKLNKDNSTGEIFVII